MSMDPAFRTTPVSRVYADVNCKKPQEYWDYENHIIDWNSMDNYVVCRRIGCGKYSEAFDAFHIEADGTKKRCVIKVLKPVKRKRIKREVNILRNLCGGPNIVSLYDCIRDDVTKTYGLVFEFVNNTPFKTVLENITDLTLRKFIYEILLALDYCHSRGIIHRDVKPQNVMYDSSTGMVRLIDWGLAEFYHPGRPLNVRVASRYYKGPELQCNQGHYDYSLDIWSLGAMFAAIIFKRDPIFMGKDNLDQLVAIAKIMGTEDLVRYLVKYDLHLDGAYDSILGTYERIPWNSFVTADNAHLATPEAIEQLQGMLVYDHQKRLTAKEVMASSYFDCIRTKINPTSAVRTPTFTPDQ